MIVAGARHDQAADFRVAELLDESLHVAVERFLPQFLARAEVAAHASRIDPFIESRGIHGNLPAVAVADDADLRVTVARFLCEPIDSSQNLLYFISQDVPA